MLMPNLDVTLLEVITNWIWPPRKWLDSEYAFQFCTEPAITRVTNNNTALSALHQNRKTCSFEIHYLSHKRLFSHYLTLTSASVSSRRPFYDQIEKMDWKIIFLILFVGTCTSGQQTDCNPFKVIR